MALCVFVGKELVVGKAWITMHGLQHHVHSLRDEPFSLLDHLVSTIESQFDDRWNMFFTDAHYMGVLLNPFMRDNAALRTDGVALHTFH